MKKILPTHSGAAIKMAKNLSNLDLWLVDGLDRRSFPMSHLNFDLISDKNLPILNGLMDLGFKKSHERLLSMILLL